MMQKFLKISAVVFEESTFHMMIKTNTFSNSLKHNISKLLDKLMVVMLQKIRKARSAFVLTCEHWAVEFGRYLKRLIFAFSVQFNSVPLLPLFHHQFQKIMQCHLQSKRHENTYHRRKLLMKITD